MNTIRPGLVRFVLDNSLLLLAGTVAAVVWANLDIDSYDRVAHPLHFVVNDIGMVFFFALAAKEVFEATLPGGALASPRRAFSPLADGAAGADLSGTHVGARTGRSGARLGNPLCDRHRFLCDDRAHRVPSGTSRDPFSPAARHRG
jgi:hypothetical protein